MDLSPISGIITGTYTSNGASQFLNLGFVPSYFIAWDITQAGSTADSVLKKVEWFANMAPASAITLSTDVTGAYDVTSLITTGGISGYNSTVAQNFAPVVITSVSKAANALVTTAAPHGLAVGDSVRLYGIVGIAGATTPAMADLNGLVFTVLTVPLTTTFTISVNTSGFNVAGAGGHTQKVFPLSYWQPKRSVIVGITQASPGVVTTAENHLLVTGDIVRINIPSNPSFGMSQLNGQLVEVKVLTGTTFSMYQPNSLGSIPINTTGYTAFAFPGGVNPPIQFAQVINVGEDSFPGPQDPKRNTAFIGLQLGAGAVGLTSDVWQYLAILGTQLTPELP